MSRGPVRGTQGGRPQGPKGIVKDGREIGCTAKYKVHESLDCLIYDSSENPQIYLYDISGGRMTHSTKLSHHVIGFMLEGSILVTFPDKSEYLFRKGEMMFMLAGSTYSWDILESTRLMVYRMLSPAFRICENFPVEVFYREDAKYLSRSEAKHSFDVLDIHPRLQPHLESIWNVVYDGVRCKRFFEMEIESFFVLLRCYYTKRELFSFLRHIMTGNVVFSEYVRLRWRDYTSVTELAASMNLTTKYFSRKFKQYFGKNPYQWMADNRARVIHEELTSTNKTLKEIAENNGFLSTSHLSVFMKKMLGKSPTDLRLGSGNYPEE